MSQTDPIRYIYAIQQIRSHLQELIEGDADKVDQALAAILQQLEAGDAIEDKFRQVLTPHPKARTWWVDFNRSISGDTAIKGSLRGISGSSSADASLYGESSPKPLSIACAKCGFINSLLSWNNQIVCQNSDPIWAKHCIKL